MNWNETEDRPDWPVELDEPVAKLGKPDGIYRTSPKKALYKTLSGIGLILFGILINYLYWFVFKGPVIPDKFFFLILFGSPVGGILLIMSAIRDRGMWILVYSLGFLRWHRKEVLTFLWDELVSLRFNRLNNPEEVLVKVDETGLPYQAWIPVDRGSSRIFGSQLYFQRADGNEGYISSSLENYDELAKQIQIRHFERAWPNLWATYSRGEPVVFVGISVTNQGLEGGKEPLPWNELEDIKITNGKLVVSRKGKWRSWLELPIVTVLNPHLLLTLIQFAKPMLAVTIDPEKKEPAITDL